jgi:predicted MPP superfamily phosphohydrolase
MRALFFTCIFAAMAMGDVTWWRWADRRLKRLPGRRVSRPALAVFSGFMLVYLVAALAFPAATRRSRGPVPLPVHAAAFLWHLLVLPVSLVSALVTWVSRRSAHIVTKHRSQNVSSPVQSDRPSRRDALGAAAVAIPPLLMGGATAVALRQLGDVRIRRFDLALLQLPSALDGMTIAHVSDLHVGKFTRDGSLMKLADQVNAMRCDFVAVTGDLIDLAMADLPRSLAMIRRLDPRHGLVICEGNHDLIENPTAFESEMASSGLEFLLESERTMTFRGEPVQFLGIRWAHSDAELAASVSRVRPLIRPDAFPILLAHHPHAFDAAAAAGVPLTLSGHTHGGQIMLNERLGFGPAMFRYWSGLYQKGTSSLVVSNGAGNWFPLRINAPADIVHLTLRRAVD